jgi:hypothetical protein
MLPDRTEFAPADGSAGSVIGADDLVAVMTPEMAATDITFARRSDDH